MSKTKYKYNPKTLSYEEAKSSVGQRILKSAIFIAPSILIGLGLAFLLETSVETPREKELKAKVEFFNKEVEKLKRKSEVISKVADDIKKRDEELYRIALYADAFPEELRKMGIGGADKYAYLESTENTEVIKATNEMIDEVKSKLYAQSISFQQLLSVAKDREARLASLPAIQPVNNKDLTRMASGYGWRVDPVYKTRKMHWGMDFTADVGTDVYATGEGKVVECAVNSWGYGKEVVIDHGFGYKTRYAHLSKFKVKVGDKVKRGDLIGLVGSTGKSTGPHLHYEVEKNGQKVNPISFYHSDLSPEQYQKLLEMSKNSNKSFD